MADRVSELSITTDANSSVTVLKADGVLDSTTYRRLRDTIISAALKEPAAVVVDVTDLDVPARSAWTVFTSAHWRVRVWPRTPLALVCTRAAGRDVVRRHGVTRYVPVHATLDQAVQAAEHGAPQFAQRAGGHLRADNSSVWRARRMVAGWLDMWSLPDLVPATKVVATVLVENVLHHTGSAPSLRLETDGETVTVAVEDESPKLAELIERPSGGQGPSGLSIVAALSRAWGNATTGPGKTVWAVIGAESRM
ncbi:ATP-binding protein [Mycobacterium deserti]|uniref:ATP-binding protein n=1 Tax=Mycobacterium deserti TaxID=2978347 RepID=A0ABT2M5A2_9MYCO|nr:ATP-binding protein [Mycobacterium deserti]MCT7657434.1 ATP-binding protein [Mycobacterium deserti]